MGLLSGLKRAFNIGGCSIAIQPDADQHDQGGTVAGTVRLTGGGYDQEARSLRISLVEFWTESRGSGKNRRTVTVTHEQAVATLASPCRVAAGAAQEHAFALALPLDARLATPGGRAGWRLTVALDVPGAVDPSGSIDLAVGPAPQVLALIRLWEETLQWREAPGNRGWQRHDRRTRFRLLPPAGLAGEFDHLDIACGPLADGDWQAGLDFDLQEKGLLDRLKALVDLDKARHGGFRIPAAALAGDTAARAACARELVAIMQGIIARRAPR